MVSRKIETPHTSANSMRRPAPKQHSAERQEHLLRVATQVFLDKGFSETTIDTVAVTAGVSKATIYRHYRNKEELFESAILSVTNNVIVEATNLNLSDVHGSLLAWSRAYYKAYSTPEAIELTRIMITEAARQPNLVKRIRAIQIEQSLSTLIEYFKQLQKHKKLIKIDPVELAVDFAMLVLGGFRSLLAAKDTGPASAKRIENSVNLFLSGCLH